MFEHSPSTNVTRVRFPHGAIYVGFVRADVASSLNIVIYVLLYIYCFSPIYKKYFDDILSCKVHINVLVMIHCSLN